MVYDPRGRGELCTNQIFSMLDGMPEGCRLENDLLGLIKAVAAKSDAGVVPPRISQDEYVRGLHGLHGEYVRGRHTRRGALAAAAIDEPDVLGLRRRRKAAEASQLMRAQAKSLMLVRRWGLKPHDVPACLDFNRETLRGQQNGVGKVITWDDRTRHCELTVGL